MLQRCLFRSAIFVCLFVVLSADVKRKAYLLRGPWYGAGGYGKRFAPGLMAYPKGSKHEGCGVHAAPRYLLPKPPSALNWRDGIASAALRFGTPMQQGDRRPFRRNTLRCSFLFG